MTSVAEMQSELAIASLQRLAESSELHDGALSSRVHLGQKVLLLDTTGQPLGDASQLDAYAKHFSDIKDENFPSNCRRVASSVFRATNGTGLLHGNELLYSFIGFYNHWMNWDILTDRTHLAVDLTASHSIDRRQGSFDILAIRAMGRSQLNTLVEVVYGGTWKFI